MENGRSNNWLNGILISIGIGVWTIVLQNAGILSTEHSVYVSGGYVDAEVEGTVSVDNTVDINIEEVNGYSNAFYGPGKSGTYDALHVYTGQ